jgi:hypothetical protein
MAGPAPSFAAFLSYAPLDGAKAGEIRELLEGLGMRCILAARGLRGGRGASSELRSELERARAFVLVVSRATEVSRPAREEMLAAHRRGMPIFGIFIEPPEPSSELDFFVPARHRIDASSGRLADRVAELAGHLRSADPQSLKRLGGPELPGWARFATGMPGVISVLALAALLLWALSRMFANGFLG